MMLEAHADTVGVDNMTIAPFEPEVRDGRLYGRGACDTKASMAAMLLGIKRVLDEDGVPPVTVYFVSTCDEEIGASGARVLTTLLYAMEDRGAETGLAALCLGGGDAVALSVRRIG